MAALPTTAASEPSGPTSSGREVTRLRDLSPQQWKSGVAAWLGWLFDGLDMHLFVLVAAPFVAELLGGIEQTDPRVRDRSSWIQAAFLIGWALGGGFFGRVADRLGRSRALSVAVLTYAGFAGRCPSPRSGRGRNNARARRRRASWNCSVAPPGGSPC